MTYLIVGLDRTTLAPWHRNLSERDPARSARAARERAGAHGVDLVVAAVIGANSTVLGDRAQQSVRLLNAA
jgi:hypothetical protein